MSQNLVESFEEFLTNKYADICLTCWGEGKLKAIGHFLTWPVECPNCKGTGKKP